MRIDEIRWTNYRRLADARLSVRGHLVLLGPNDSGKSSVLRAIHLCLGVPGTQLSSSVQPRDLTSPDQPLVLEVVLATKHQKYRELKGFGITYLREAGD